MRLRAIASRRPELGLRPLALYATPEALELAASFGEIVIPCPESLEAGPNSFDMRADHFFIGDAEEIELSPAQSTPPCDCLSQG